MKEFSHAISNADKRSTANLGSATSNCYDKISTCFNVSHSEMCVDTCLSKNCDVSARKSLWSSHAAWYQSLIGRSKLSFMVSSLSFLPPQRRFDDFLECLALKSPESSKDSSNASDIFLHMPILYSYLSRNVEDELLALFPLEDINTWLAILFGCQESAGTAVLS